jgi:hypothetical protein
MVTQVHVELKYRRGQMDGGASGPGFYKAVPVDEVPVATPAAQEMDRGTGTRGGGPATTEDDDDQEEDNGAEKETTGKSGRNNAAREYECDDGDSEEEEDEEERGEKDGLM